MLKIKKLKKKKDKKKKKDNDSDLFNPQELEEFKKEQEELQKKDTNSEEWKQFNNLTADIDSILKKTQGNLDRIKSTSFFQKSAPKSSANQEADTKAETNPEESEQNVPVIVLTEKDFQLGLSEKPTSSSKGHHHQGSKEGDGNEGGDEDDDDEEDDKDEEDIFDTSYVEAVESGQFKLAYIPDSPAGSEDECGFDPFDTSAAESAILGPAASTSSGVKLLPLGVAVDVLSGRVDNIKYIPVKTQNNRRRFKPKDLLLQSIDQEEQDTEEASTLIEDSIPVKTLLDEDTEADTNLPSQIDLSKNLVVDQKNTADLAEEDDDDDDEFAKLATESIKKVNLFEDKEIFDYPIGTDKEDDPFDTSIANNIIPGKAELRQIEQEILGDINDDFFDPRSEEKFRLILSPPFQAKPSEDLLRRSSSFFNFDIKTIQPSSSIDYKDPFDTEIAESANQPGKTELKLIANEILSSIDDDSFDPRAFEADNRKEIELHLDLNKSVSFSLDENCSESKESKRKVSTPYSTKSLTEDIADQLLETEKFDTKALTPIRVQESVEEDYDPFDTSICNQVSAPGKTELKLLDKELNTTDSKKDTLSTDLFSTDTDLDLVSVSVKPLSPIVSKSISIEENDPFDTSVASNLTIGKTELKVIESEFTK